MSVTQDPTEEPIQIQAQGIIVIHPGSLNLRIGRASDLNPHTEVHAIARRRKSGGSKHVDTLLPSLVPKMKDLECELDSARLSVSLTLQSCVTSSGGRRYATPPQQVAAFNKRSPPRPLSTPPPPYTQTSEEVVVGDQVLNLDPSLDYNIHFPIKRGDLNVHAGVGGSLTSVIADLRTIWLWTIENKLDIPMKEMKNYRAVLIVPDIYNRHYLKELTTLLLEMGFSSCFLLQDHVAATFGAGLGAACVIDCGHSKTSISCVEDGITQPATRIRLPYGGGDVTQCLGWLLGKCSFPYESWRPGERARDAILMEELKRSVCHLDLDVCGPRETSFTVGNPPGPLLGYTIQVADECMIAPLGLFTSELFGLTGPKSALGQKRSLGDPADPHDADYLRETSRRGAKEAQEGGEPPAQVEEDLVDIEMGGESEFIPAPQLLALDQAVLQSIQRCGSDDLKRKMYSCILVVGGGMKFKGISTWLQNKIALQIPFMFRTAEQLDIVTSPKEMDPVMTAWKGAAIMACLESAHELWILPEEWHKYSVRVLRERAPFIW